VIIFIILLIVFLRYRTTINYIIIGTWTTDGVTVYEFNKNKTGKLILPLSEYDFDYEINDNRLHIEFKHNSIDSDYIISFEDKKLILIEGKIRYVFTKKE